MFLPASECRRNVPFLWTEDKIQMLKIKANKLSPSENRRRNIQEENEDNFVNVIFDGR